MRPFFSRSPALSLFFTLFLRNFFVYGFHPNFVRRPPSPPAAQRGHGRKGANFAWRAGRVRCTTRRRPCVAPRTRRPVSVTLLSFFATEYPPWSASRLAQGRRRKKSARAERQKQRARKKGTRSNRVCFSDAAATTASTNATARTTVAGTVRPRCDSEVRRRGHGRRSAHASHGAHGRCAGPHAAPTADCGRARIPVADVHAGCHRAATANSGQR